MLIICQIYSEGDQHADLGIDCAVVEVSYDSIRDYQRKMELVDFLKKKDPYFRRADFTDTRVSFYNTYRMKMGTEEEMGEIRNTLVEKGWIVLPEDWDMRTAEEERVDLKEITIRPTVENTEGAKLTWTAYPRHTCLEIETPQFTVQQLIDVMDRKHVSIAV